MNQFFKLGLASTLAVLMVFSGCSTAAPPASTPESAKASSTEADSSTAVQTDVVSPEGEFPIVATPVEISIMVPSLTSIEDIETNSFTKEYEEKTNVKVKWIVVPQDSLSDKVNISLSSGDLPDVYMCGITQTQQQVYGGQGAFLPMNDYIDKYGNVLKAIGSKIDGLIEVITMGDGKIYCLPYIEQCQHCENSSKMWANTQWLKKLNLKIPTTVEEFEAMLMAFKNDDPNGNGLADEIPLLTFEEGWHSNAISGYLTNPFVYTSPDNSYVFLDNGTIKLSYLESGWKDAMKWLNKLYKDGLYYDQSLVINQDQARQVAANGADKAQVVGCYPNGVPGSVPGDDASLWTDYVAISPIKGPAGQFATWTAYSKISPNAFVITSANKNPEASFRWGVEQYNRDICYRKTFGVENANWKKVTPGKDDIPADAVDLRSGKPSAAAVYVDGVGWGDLQNYCWRNLGLRCDTADVPDLRYDQFQPGDYNTDLEYRLAYDTRDNMAPYIPDISICLPPLVYTEEQSTTLANSESVVLTYMKEMAARFITGDADVETEWENYMKEMDVKGANTLKGIYQAAYDEKYKK